MANQAKLNTQFARRAKYGVNVAVAVLVAVAIVVLINWIAHRQTDARLDLTATRAYSLSAQTRKVIDNLDGEYRIVTLFGEDMPELTRIRDVVDQYGRRSSQVRVQHLDPDLDIGRREQLHRDVRDHFADDLEPFVEAVDVGRAALTRLAEGMPAVTDRLNEMLDDPALTEGNVRQRIQRVAAAMTQQQTAIARQLESLDETFAQALPDYVAVKQVVHQRLEELEHERGLLPIAVQWFDSAADDASAPAHVRNGLLELKRDLEALRAASREGLSELRLAEPPARYDEALQGLELRQTVVVLGPAGLRVIPASEMYPDAGTGQSRAGSGETAGRFLGEERLTGTLISMGLEQPPLVVFVFTGRQPALGERGMFRHVAARLQAANFQVEQWNPIGRTSATGQSLPPAPAPRPARGQRAVWIVNALGAEANPMTGGDGGEAQVAALLRERLAEGDGALVSLMFDPNANLAGDDPMVEMLRDQWGIQPQRDRLLLREEQAGEQSQASARMELSRWPDALPISQALSGMPGLFLQSFPLRIAEPSEGVRHWPLVELQGSRLWSAPNITSADALRSARFEAAEARDRFTVGVAAERSSGAGRLVAVGDPAWALDQVTTIRWSGSDASGARFPANSELFINSVYWLAGLDGLIAASPRTQDIRRIGAISENMFNFYRFGVPAALPLLALGAGVVVWLVRRRV